MNDTIVNRGKAILRELARVVLSFGTIFGLIEILKQNDWPLPFSFYYLPKLSEIIGKCIEYLSSPRYYFNILVSLERVYGGFFCAFLLALPLAVLITEYKAVNYLVFPFIEFIRPIPNAAWVPLSILLFKSIDGSVFFITFIGAFFPILINAVEGLNNINPNYLKVARSFNISHFSCIWEVKIPAAGPNIFTGTLLGMSGSWLGVIVAEMMNGESGIGYMTWVSYTLMDIAGVVVYMFTIGLLGALSGTILRRIYKRMHWGNNQNEKIY